MKPETLAELKALEREATAGPWKFARFGVKGEMPGVMADLRPEIDDWLHICSTEYGNEPEPDAKLIAALRNAAPELIAAAERGALAQEMADALRSVADQFEYDSKRDGYNAWMRELSKRFKRVRAVLARWEALVAEQKGEADATTDDGDDRDVNLELEVWDERLDTD